VSNGQRSTSRNAAFTENQNFPFSRECFSNKVKSSRYILQNFLARVILKIGQVKIIKIVGPRIGVWRSVNDVCDLQIH